MFTLLECFYTKNPESTISLEFPLVFDFCKSAFILHTKIAHFAHKHAVRLIYRYKGRRTRQTARPMWERGPLETGGAGQSMSKMSAKCW